VSQTKFDGTYMRIQIEGSGLLNDKANQSKSLSPITEMPKAENIQLVGKK